MEAARERPRRPAPPVSQDIVDHSSQIKSFHDEAYRLIQQGLTCDEQGQTEQALSLYTSGLRNIDRALDLQYSRENESVEKMVQKMRRTKLQIQTRVKDLIRSDANVARAIDDPPPSYEESTSPTTSASSEFDFLFVEGEDYNQASMVANAQQLFKIPDGVQIFYITPEGYVSAPSYPTSLGVYKFQEQAASNAETPPAFLKVGDWTYPLLPNSSPVLHTSYGAYIFPDVSTENQGSAVGLIIPETLSAAEKSRFESVLSSLTAMRTQTPSSSMEEVATRSAQVVAPARPAPPRAAEARPEAREDVKAKVAPPRPQVVAREAEAMDTRETGEEEGRTSTAIAKGLVTAADWISWGLEKGAEKASEWMKKGSGALKGQLEPEAQPKNVDPRAQQGVKYARQATHVAVKVSGFLVKKLGEATVALAKQVAPHIRKQGEKLLPDSMKPTHGKGERSKVDDVFEVAASGLQGFGTVYLSLEKAAKDLFKNLADETVQVVHHKYGAQAGELTENGLYAAGNAALAGHNIRNLGVKAIAKRAAKDAGKEVVKDYAKKKKVPTATLR